MVLAALALVAVANVAAEARRPKKRSEEIKNHFSGQRGAENPKTKLSEENAHFFHPCLPNVYCTSRIKLI